MLNFFQALSFVLSASAQPQNDTEVILNTLTGSKIAQDNGDLSTRTSNTNKIVPVTLLQRLNPGNVFKPIAEKLAEVSNFFIYPYHPNYGGVNFLNPALLLERLGFPNNHHAIYGLGSWGGHDYPFAYRSKARASRSLRDKLNYYVELHKPHSNFKFGHLKNDGAVNKTVYDFPHFFVKDVGGNN